jgi:type I restriction enzyme S subunit
VQKLVQSYRQSVLKAAVTGELTREWREQRKGQLESGEALLERILQVHREAWEQSELERLRVKGAPINDKWKQKYKEPSQLGSTPRPKLPVGWTWASVEQAGEVRLGRQRAPQHHSGDHMRPYLRVANVYEDRLDLSDVKEMNFTPDEFETYALRDGDILLNEGQSPELVGRPAMYRGEVPGSCYQKTLLRFRVREGIRSDFALLVFRSYLHSGRFRRSASITTSIAHLAAERFVVIEFPVPSEAEQVQIVDLATSKLSVIAHLERELAEQRKAATSLRQSVLAAAFSGILVDQELTVERRVA